MLICIPDISGFTKFMSEAESDLSSKVVPALLNKIIYSNEIGLRVSEIEGDAVLFFRKGELPSLDELINQCSYFYTEFYRQLDTLDNLHTDKNSIATIKEALGLKIVLHYGEDVEAVNIGKHIKLMGEDVVIAHKLLKNDIDKDEYILFSDVLLEKYGKDNLDDRFHWATLKHGGSDYDHIGEVTYAYINLEPLQKN